MFVYQNAERNICVTFEDNKPVENPEYVLIIDEEAKTLALEGDDADLYAEIADLKATLAKKDTTIATLNLTITDLEARIDELEKSDAE